jgi:two-component system sensor histidine kinase ChiS
MLRAVSPTGFRGRLLLILLAMSLLPLLATALAFFYILDRNVQGETFAKLAFVRDAKRGEIEQYLTFAARQAESLSKSNAVRYSIGDFYGFSYAFRKIDPSPERATAILHQIFGIDGSDGQELPADNETMLRAALEYANVHQQFHDDFASFVRTAEFDNLYLINPERRVVYSVEKDRYLGAELRGALATTPLGLIYKAAFDDQSEAGSVVRDFERDTVTGEFVAYFAVKVQFYHKFRGVMVFRMTARGLDRLVQSQRGDAAGLYLVNSGGLFISAPAERGLAAGASAALEPATLDQAQAIVSSGPAGEPALTASTKLRFGGVPWSLVAEVPAATAFADSNSLRHVVGIMALALLPILIGLVLYLSAMMTRPLQTLTSAAEAIAEGDLEHSMPAISAPTELGRLTASFRRMRDAVRDQLGLIGQKNVELEKQVGLIAEKNAALEEADRIKDTFLANTSHELRTPLNGLIGIAETLAAGAAGELTAMQRSQLQLITFSARRLSRLVDDLLDLYRIRHGRLRLDIHPVHVASSIKNVLQLSEPLLHGEPVTLSVEIPADMPFVMADPVRFEQILYNLLGNAIKYTDQGSIRIAATHHGDCVAIHVEDTGIGIAGDNLDRIFQPLEQAGSAETSRAPEGTGLGLTIARQLATLLSGELTASSELGQGSCFTLRLPAAPVASADDAPAGEWLDGGRLRETMDRAKLADLPAAAGAPVILVVDDEPINIQVLRNVLQPQGYVVRVAESGIEALNLVERLRPDLVILDVMMPGMSGLEVAKQIRARHSLLDMAILMVTARSRTRDVIAGFEHGANDYVIKPFVKDELLARVATLVEVSRARDRAQENSELRLEVERRVQVEDALRLSQQRMARLLDTLDVALLCTDARGRVSYANQAAIRCFDQQLVFGGTPLSALVGAELAETMTSSVAEEGEVLAEDVRLGTNLGALRFHAFELDAGGGLAVVIRPRAEGASEDSDNLIRSVRGAIDSVGPDLTHRHAAPAAGVDERGAAGDGSKPDSYRQTIVDVMTQSLFLWRLTAETGKLDFAERSGIWRVNFDRTSLQARTLDKYMLIETLPLKPRWRDVVRSAEFALAHAAKTGRDDAEVDQAANGLKATLGKLRSQLRDSRAAAN